MIKSFYAERTRGASDHVLATGVRTALTIGAGATVLALIATRYDTRDFVWRGTVAVARSRSGCITQFHNLRNTPQPATSRHFPKSRLRTQYHCATRSTYAPCSSLLVSAVSFP